MKRLNLGYYLGEGFRGIKNHGMMSFSAVCMIVGCLLIMGTFTLLAVNLEHMLSRLEAENEFLAYIDETYTTEQARALEADVLAVENVSTAEFVTREQALEQYREDRKGNELLNELPATALRDRFRIRVHEISRMQDTVEQVRAINGVVNISAQVEVAQGFTLVRNIAGGVALVLVAVLMLVSMFIISNTVRLATFYRREEIAIMKMCGATNGFVRWPFVVEGAILGLIGSLLAFFLQWGIYHFVCSAVIQSNGLSLLTVLPYGDMARQILLTFLGSGFLIGVGGSLLAIRKFLQV